MNRILSLCLGAATLVAPAPAFAQDAAASASSGSSPPGVSAKSSGPAGGPGGARATSRASGAEAGSAAPDDSAAEDESARGDDVEAAATAATTEVVDWERPMQLYQLGETEQALAALREQILSCAPSGDEACSKQKLATLYFCLGIVQAGGMEEHQKGVTAFAKSLALNPEVVLLPEYDKPTVRRAFDEARGVRPAAPEARVVLPVSAEVEEEDDEVPGYYRGKKKRRALLLVTGTGRYSYVSIYGRGYYDDFNVDYDYAEGERFQAGGAVTFVGMPGETSGFSMGARARAGVYAGRDAVGYVGGSAVLGATVGPRVDGQFMTFLGTMGVEWAPAYQRAGFALGAVTSFSFSGFTLGPSVTFVGAEDYVSASFGLELGLGLLL